MTHQNNQPLTRDQVAQINAICIRFERAWQSGQALTIEAVAAGADSSIRATLIQHLVEIDIQSRVARGFSVDLDSYLGRWPNLDRVALESAQESAGNGRSVSWLPTAGSNFDSGSTEQTRTASNSADFLRRLRDAALLGDADIAAAAEAVGSRSVEQIAKGLIESRKLTAYQAQSLMEETSGPLVLGDYVVQDLIGCGGMGAVYRAIHRRMKRTVAIKVLRRDIAHADVLAKRFLREVEVAARLRHPNIVTAYDAGEHLGISYLVSEYVEGQNLGDLVRQYGPLSLSVAVDIVYQAAIALEYAHGQGIIHRDIKPSNMLVDDAGNVKLLDVGLARINQNGAIEHDDSAVLTTTGMIMGTVDYMSPEQAQNTRLADERSDVYSLGCTLYFLITGRAPYSRGTGIERLLAHREQPIPSLRALSDLMPERIDNVLQRMMAKKPNERIASMSEVAELLDQLRTAGIPDVSLPLFSFEESAEVPGRISGVVEHHQVPATQLDVSSNDEPLQLTDPSNAPTLIIGEKSESLETETEFHSEATNISQSSPHQPVRLARDLRAPSMARLIPWILIPGVVAIAGVVYFQDRGSPSGSGPLSGGHSGEASIETSDGEAILEDLVSRDEISVAKYRDRWAARTRVELEQVVNGIVFIFVPPGRFRFGDDQSDEEVTIETPFWLSEVEVTVGQFREFVLARRGYQTLAERDGTGWGKLNGRWVQQSPYCWRDLGESFVNSDMPACNMAYPDAIAFCEWASSKSGRVVRLPTEQEWEYACRCGRRGVWSFGDDGNQLSEYAWYAANSDLELKTVRGKLSNAWGLYDMHGNESEWCLEPCAVDGNFDGHGILRGGSFASSADETRSTSRVSRPLTNPTQGAFRVLMEH